MTDQETPPKRPLWAFLPVLLALAITAAAAFVLLQGRERAFVTNEVAGRAAPEYAMPSLTGDAQVTPQAFVGRAYLINAFASWCVPCRAEHPMLLQLAEQGVPILGLAYKDDPAATARFLAELGNPYAAVGVDPVGAVHMDLGAAGVPETFVVSADGRLLAVHRSPLTPQAVEEIILPALRAGENQ